MLALLLVLTHDLALVLRDLHRELTALRSNDVHVHHDVRVAHAKVPEKKTKYLYYFNTRTSKVNIIYYKIDSISTHFQRAQ